MKRCLIILLMFGLCLKGYCQETKKKTIKNHYPSYKEVFYVLKSSQKVKHGEYIRTSRGKVQVKGQFENDLKTGIWEFYDWKGDLAHKYNFTTSEVVFDKELNDNQFDTAKYLRPALYVGGTSFMFTRIGEILEYPRNAIRRGIQGEVLIKLDISEDGKLINETIVKSVGGGCDEETLRVFKSIPNEWIPALDKDGKPIRSELFIPLTFQVK